MFDYRGKTLSSNIFRDSTLILNLAIYFGIKFLFGNYSHTENLHFFRILKLNFITHINLNSNFLI